MLMTSTAARGRRFYVAMGKKRKLEALQSDDIVMAVKPIASSATGTPA